MSQHLSWTETRSPTATTPFSDPLLARLRRAMGSINGRPVLMAGVEVSEADRQRISVLATSYRDRLSPGRDNRRELAVVLAKLLAAFPASASAGETSTDLRMAAYLEAVETMPAWAVDAARLAILRGETDADPRFAPTPPQLARAARAAMRPMAETAADLDRIAMASGVRDVSPEERARVAEGFDVLASELGRGRPIDPARTASDRLAEMCAEAGVDPDSVPDAPERRGSVNRIGSGA